MPRFKSQVPIDFLFSLAIFIIVLLLISHSLMENLFMNKDIKEREKNLLLGFAVSELLIYDKGVPSDWNNIYLSNRLGFSEDFYKLKREKVLSINNCNNNDYNRIKYLLSLPYEKDFEIIFKKTNGEVLAICGKQHPYRKFIEIKRASSLDNEVVLLIVRIYQ